MTLYTIMPLEQVLEGIRQERASKLEIQHEGMLLQVEPIAPGAGKLIRIVQADLECYLNPAYSPGTLIHYGSGSK
ncbi:YlzJ-like family protein [Paenibacillus humicus]|uniref:YlzJ-like family protein n=1 Tax=Paenibacillus humicus TaxID=412861 RepID=UPI000FD989FC|nr:YlzJ-like family protein [Paenibacillus humicus]